MNTETSQFAVQVLTKAVSEAVQRVAFGYGYGWFMSGQEVRNTQYVYLVLDPVKKTIAWDDNEESVKEVVFEIVNSFDRLIELLQNPPSEVRTFGNLVYRKNGNVEFPSGTMGGTSFDEFVKARNEFLGVEKPVRKLPVVRFYYNSKSKGWAWRNVAVVAQDSQFVAGYDLDDDNTYKRYLRNNMGSDVVFKSLKEMPE